MTAKPEVKVTLRDAEFTLTELEDFIDRCRAVDGIEHNALVGVRVAASNPDIFELACSTEYRSKE